MGTIVVSGLIAVRQWMCVRARVAGVKVGGIYIDTHYCVTLADAHIQAPAILISISGDLPETQKSAIINECSGVEQVIVARAQ